MRQHADVCLILEGTYPFVSGGVSNWAHELICEQNHLKFHLLAIVPPEEELELKYQLPGNVVSLTTVRLGELPEGDKSGAAASKRLYDRLSESLFKITSDEPAKLEHFKQLVNTLRDTNLTLGEETLLNREAAWEHLLEVYEERFDEHSFLDFFWSYRAISGGIYSALLCDLPSADIYHALSTGYAGLIAARAKIETGKPAMLTEHGIYTNERRIEVASADWLSETASKSLTIDKPRRDLRDLWIDSISNFSRLCYQACDEVITLFQKNQAHQIADGASAGNMRVIPNGVDLQKYGSISRRRNRVTPTIALIGRVVPIKDIKSYIRAIAGLKQMGIDAKAYIIGPTNEDEDYFDECKTMVTLLNLEEQIEFTGRQNIDSYLEEIDVLVLSSLSESQPLVMLEAGAAGIPLVSTDVGACREMIEGNPDVGDTLGHGGFVTPLANPAAITTAIATLLSDDALYEKCSTAIRQRVHEYHDLAKLQKSYRDLYPNYLGR
jgi:glycosyltransferase involved in cell wall biosynthesis